MKLNWGHKIAIAYTAFAGFMIFMLILSMQEDHELVTENYYENELAVQQRIDADKNLNESDLILSITSNSGNIVLNLKGLSKEDSVSGTVELYKPDDASLDETHELKLTESGLMVIKPLGNRGRYKVQVSFEVNAQRYFREQQILL
jgi:hypothetical protein